MGKYYYKATKKQTKSTSKLQASAQNHAINLSNNKTRNAVIRMNAKYRVKERELDDKIRYEKEHTNQTMRTNNNQASIRIQILEKETESQERQDEAKIRFLAKETEFKERALKSEESKLQHQGWVLDRQIILGKQRQEFTSNGKVVAHISLALLFVILSMLAIWITASMGKVEHKIKYGALTFAITSLLVGYYRLCKIVDNSPVQA